MKPESMKIEDVQYFINGYEIMKLLNLPNIIKAYGIFLSDKTKSTPSILLEYCEKTLNKVIKDKTLSQIDIVFAIYQIAEGMKYFHSKKIIHRYLKPLNILISNDDTLKISDFSIFWSNDL